MIEKQILRNFIKRNKRNVNKTSHCRMEAAHFSRLLNIPAGNVREN